DACGHEVEAFDVVAQPGLDRRVVDHDALDTGERQAGTNRFHQRAEIEQPVAAHDADSQLRLSHYFVSLSKTSVCRASHGRTSNRSQARRRADADSLARSPRTWSTAAHNASGSGATSRSQLCSTGTPAPQSSPTSSGTPPLDEYTTG